METPFDLGVFICNIKHIAWITEKDLRLYEFPPNIEEYIKQGSKHMETYNPNK